MTSLTRMMRWTAWLLLFLVLVPGVRSQSPSASGTESNILVLVVRGTVQYSPQGATRWLLLRTNDFLSAGDRVRVGALSQLAVRLADQSVARFDEMSEFEVLAPKPAVKTGFRARLTAGILYFFHREKPTEVEVETRLASAAVRGTEFALRITREGATEVVVFDGEVELRNALGVVPVRNGEMGTVEEGRPPARQIALEARSAIQWTLYYPGVLDLEELPLGERERGELADSLEAYRAGDLLRAVAAYPEGRSPTSDGERVYRAALVVAAGQAEEARAILAEVKTGSAGNLAEAIRRLVAVAQGTAVPPTVAPERAPEMATEWLAESYRRQGRFELGPALEAARAAVAKSPRFGFAWARVAELEFGFGRTERAREALTRALEYSPRNAQALALEGFVLAARNRLEEAIARFEEAMAVDGGLANAWLGRGLTRIRLGRAREGREDLLAAAALEPQRSSLRSYLGKGWTDAGEWTQAVRELERARELDPRDPTPWLYAALLKEQLNQINGAVRDLEQSKRLNENRGVYRSRFLLEQDQAVRSANLARIYREAGMEEWSVLEASRAVSADYANYSAHLFLADSYSFALDPVNRRFETPANAEYLVANLLAPPRAGVLSPTISQNEYSNFFERNRVGFVSTTEYLSRGAWTESAAVFGNTENLGYSLEGFYQDDPGQRPNNDVRERLVSVQIKPRLTATDTALFRADFAWIDAGDAGHPYDPKQFNPSYRVEEEAEPNLLLGYHHEWSAESHTLILGSRLSHRASFADPFRAALLVQRTGDQVDALQDFSVEESHRDKIEIYSIEPQQIWQTEKQSTVAGLRAQTGHIETEFTQVNPGFPVEGFFPFAPTPIATADFRNDFERVSVYGYHQHQVLDSLRLVVGLSYDYLRFPLNWRFSPISDEAGTQDQWSPKAGFVWTPSRDLVVRGAYTRSLAGATIDQSFQIEPTQVAGINQSFRSIIPETLAGGNTGAEFETYGVSLEQKLRTGTFITAGGEILNSDVERTLGTYDLTGIFDIVWAGLRQNLGYTERSAHAAIYQLWGEGFSFGAQYRIDEAELDSIFPQIGEGAFVFDRNLAERPANQSLTSVLHEVRLSGIYNHPRGFFGEIDGTWRLQSNEGADPDQPGDSFWQLDLFVGWRTPGRNVEVLVGLLNATDQDYRLSPLNLVHELPRDRTLVVRTRLSF